MVKVKASWSGKPFSLCNGEWTLNVNGKNVSNLIPEKLRNSPMNTYGIYERWYFENWHEKWGKYIDGLCCVDWIKENKYWLNNITEDGDIQAEIYDAINTEDWRMCSCGGCI